MKKRMTHAARAELANAIRSRYGTASGNEKRRILDEFIAASGYQEKSAIRVLGRGRRTIRHRRHANIRWIGPRKWNAGINICGRTRILRSSGSRCTRWRQGLKAPWYWIMRRLARPASRKLALLMARIAPLPGESGTRLIWRGGRELREHPGAQPVNESGARSAAVFKLRDPRRPSTVRRLVWIMEAIDARKFLSARDVDQYASHAEMQRSRFEGY